MACPHCLNIPPIYFPSVFVTRIITRIITWMCHHLAQVRQEPGRKRKQQAHETVGADKGRGEGAGAVEGVSELEVVEELEGEGQPEVVEELEREGQPEGMEELEGEGQLEGVEEPEDEGQPEGVKEPEGVEEPEGEGQPEGVEEPEGEGQPEGVEEQEGEEPAQSTWAFSWMMRWSLNIAVGAFTPSGGAAAAAA